MTINKQRLAWLARNMQHHNQEVFLIEDLQPSWLTARRWQWIYVLASRMIFGLVIRSMNSEIFGLAIGLPFGLINLLRFEWLRKQTRTKESYRHWWSVIFGLSIGLSVGLSSGLSVGLNGGLGVGLTYGLIFGLIFGLFFGPRGSRRSLDNDTQTVDALRWSWTKGIVGGIIGLIIGGLIGGLIFGLREGLLFELFGGLFGGLVFGLLFGLTGLILKGLNPQIIETKSFPNQGIWLSIRSAIFGGLIVGLSIGLMYGLLFGLIDRPGNALTDAGFFVLFFGLIAVLWYGGLDVIQHYTLRLILIIQGHTPRNYAHFLDSAVDRIFLQKVGGGYRFIHRMLLEHFAEMYEEKA